jgi:hypothetical protein
MTLFRSISVHRPRRARHRVAAVLGGTALVAASVVGTGGATAQGAVALPAECHQVGSTVTCTYQQAGVQRVFPVPAGVTSVKVSAVGGRGGRAGALGGSGALLTGTLTVEPDMSLYVTVGGAASADQSCLSGFVQCLGGANGGGMGHAGGGGGGSSEIRTAPTGLANRVVVAAGGGGAGADAMQGTAQGGGGGNAGRSGSDGTGLGAGTGGEAGTNTIGGAGGTADGQDGRPLDGGDSTGANDSAGAGGGGLFGGGSGGVGARKGTTASGGGGGGSSLAPGGFSLSAAAQTTPASVVLTYGLPDNQPPSITFSTPAPTEATGPEGAAVTYEATATDAVDGPVAVTCTPASGSAFPVGVTPVACQAADGSGNIGTGGGWVTVTDTTPPTLTVPDEVVVASGTATLVTFVATATDLADGSVTPTCTPASGSSFPVGRATVTCTATDRLGNTATRTFVVLVEDGMPPVLQLPTTVVVEADGPEGARAHYTVSATDAVDGPLPVTCDPGSDSVFRLGDTTVLCRAVDSAGRTASGFFTVTVRDTTGPRLTVPDDITVPAVGPDGAVVTFQTSATDTVSNVGPVTCSPASGSTFAVGATTVTCSVTDGAGNTTTRTFTVTVQRADLSVTVSAPSTVTRGAAATYVVTVTNLGPAAATNLRTVLALSGLTVTTTVPASVTGSVKVRGVTYTGALWTTPSLASGTSVTYTLTGTVTAKKGDAVLAQTATTNDVPDTAIANNTAKVTSTVTR